MALREKFSVDADDMSIELLEPKVCECGEVATHLVRLMIRALGQSIGVDELCLKCAREMVEQFRESVCP